ncbi:NADPH-dependent F420 reductase [Nitrososphaera viennensis]|uniref:NADPH-dependent F420 reductase n=2 Tax=Nitrososphaera viennensis TaxID=1034015 RepID=A0A977NLY7_9ARCH|nr:NADPH-dependent F420 reductase [Nitrososphaera viennensis]AIC16379.1 putative NADP oxidoreductase, coenzyme F420-dependent [Nitrososphaera viennensis EN76]UVS68315.1 NADPH-dependent F420 reductase [Nitrososphaera viennensis]
MKVGIIGSGEVGQRLGDGFIELGHDVKIGTRDPQKLAAWVEKHGGKKASAGSFAEAAAFGDIITIATLWTGTQSAIEMAGGPANFAGKVVIDVTNPLDYSTMPPRLAVGHTDSAGETVQRLLPDAKVVKAFNIVGNPLMLHPDFAGGRPTMFVCGNDDGAKNLVRGIAFSLGWETVDIGGIEGARLLEPLAMLWIVHYFRTNSGNHAFKLLRK